MYKETKRARECRNMRAAKDRKRAEGLTPDYPQALPELRRRIIIIDYDFDRVVHRIDLYRTNRVDCYRAVADGRPWKERIGWSRVLEWLRKSMVRVGTA